MGGAGRERKEETEEQRGRESMKDRDRERGGHMEGSEGD